MKGNFQRVILVCWVCVFGQDLYGQTIFDAFKKKVEIGDSAFDSFSYKKAADIFEKDYKRNADRNLIPKIAECYRKMNQPAKVAQWLSMVIHDENITGPDQILYYAQALSSQGNYEQAKKWYEKYDLLTDEYRSAYALKGLDNLDEYYKNKGSFTIEEINHNSSGKDFSPSFYKDGIVFVSNRDKGIMQSEAFKWDETAFLDLYYAPEDGAGSLKSPKKFHKNVNDVLHEGPVAFYQEGEKMLFTRNNYHNGKAHVSSDKINKLMMFEASKSGESWNNITPLHFNDNDYSVGHPTVTADGSKMYFISDMPGGYGGTDLYVCYNENGAWGRIENLGPLVNTEGNEMFPFVFEEDYLFFSSNGRDGLGGLDIFRAGLENGIVAEIENVGTPFNSPTDDFGIVLKSNGSEGYFTSNRQGGEGDDDIYHFVGGDFDYLEEELPPEEENPEEEKDITDAEIEKTIFPAAEEEANTEETITESTRQPIIENVRDVISDDVKVTFIENISGSNQVFLSTQNEIFEYRAKGDQRVLFNPNKTILLAKGNALNQQIEGLELDPELKRQRAVSSSEILDYLNDEGIRIDGIVNIENIFYDFDKDYIRADADIELDKIRQLMDENPELYLNLAAHTDSRGSRAYNVSLSKRRAMRAMEYLVANGVRKDRIITSHFSEDVLVNDCGDGIDCNENKHQQNRRTEFRIDF